MDGWMDGLNLRGVASEGGDLLRLGLLLLLLAGGGAGICVLVDEALFDDGW